MFHVYLKLLLWFVLVPTDRQQFCPQWDEEKRTSSFCASFQKWMINTLGMMLTTPKANKRSRINPGLDRAARRLRQSARVGADWWEFLVFHGICKETWALKAKRKSEQNNQKPCSKIWFLEAHQYLACYWNYFKKKYFFSILDFSYCLLCSVLTPRQVELELEQE